MASARSRGIDCLRRKVERFPFVPSDAVRRDEQAYEAYNIQVHGLMQRLRATGIEKVVLASVRRASTRPRR